MEEWAEGLLARATTIIRQTQLPSEASEEGVERVLSRKALLPHQQEVQAAEDSEQVREERREEGPAWDHSSRGQ